MASFAVSEMRTKPGSSTSVPGITNVSFSASCSENARSSAIGDLHSM